MNRVRRRQLNAVLLVGILTALPALSGSVVAWADPVEPTEPVTDPGVESASIGIPGPQDSADAISVACKQFGAALNLAASNYEDFAYATAGNGNYVDYQDPTVWRSNVIGRTALREAAAAALGASRVPGLPPEVSDPMQSWSVHATKLLLVMGLHGGGDSLNSSANQLNVDAQAAQMACALNGGRA